MIFLFLLIIVANLTSGEDSSDTKYIEELPANVKKGLLDRVARRILKEVPEVDSGDAEANGDVLAGKLEEQSDFVKRILKDEVESLKAFRLKSLRKSAKSEVSGKNGTQSNEMDSIKSVSDKMDADAGHIDLTLRTVRAKRGDSNANVKENTHEDSSTENKNKANDGDYVPVAVKPIDGKSNGRETSKDVNGNNSKDTQVVVTKNADNGDEMTTENSFDVKTTSINASQGKDVKISEDTDINVTQDSVNGQTIIDSNTKSGILELSPTSLDSNDSKTSENYSAIPDIIHISAEDLKLKLTETQDDTKDKTDELLHLDKTTSQIMGETSIKSDKMKNGAEVSRNNFTKISTLITTQASYGTTRELTQLSTKKPIEIDSNTNKNLNEEHFETTEKNNKEEGNKPKVQENTSTKTKMNSASAKYIHEDRNNSQTEHIIENKARNYSKPCNDSDPKVSFKSDCNDKKLNITATKKTDYEKSNATQTQAVDNETINNISVMVADTLKLGFKQDGDRRKTSFDSLIHFEDTQVKSEYEVYEVYSGKPAFVKHNDNDIGKNNMEQPQYVPIYNYDPEHAYFNAYNRLGPNDAESEDESKSAEIDNVKEILRSRNLRISKINKYGGMKHKKVDDYYGTTSPYISKESGCEIKEEEADEVKGFVIPESNEKGYGPNSHIKTNLDAVRQAYYSNKIFGYVPSKEESKANHISKAKYLYNDMLGKSTEEILDVDKKHKKNVRKSDDFNDASEDSGDDVNGDLGYTRNVQSENDDEKIEIVVIDMKNEDPEIKLRGGGYFDKKFKWDEKANNLEFNGVVYDLENIVPYSTEKSLVVNQIAESNKIVEIFKNFGKEENDSKEDLKEFNLEDLKNAKDYIQKLDRHKTGFNDSSIKQMIDAIERLENASKQKPDLTTNATDPKPPTNNTYLKQRVGNSIRYHKSKMRNDHKSLRNGWSSYYSHLKFPYEKDRNIKSETTTQRREHTSDGVLDTIKTVIKITPEVNMVYHAGKWLQKTWRPARSGDNDLDLYVRTLKDLVKIDDRALEKYDWLGTTVAIQSALAKLRELIDQRKNHQDMHPLDVQLLKYVEELHRKAFEATKDKEKEALESHLKDLKHVKEENNERMSLPKPQGKIKNPMKILLQISALMNDRVKRRSNVDETGRFEMSLNCLQESLYNFHTAIKEISRITKYNNQRWYRNIKELYLNSGGDKEYLELLLHLTSMRLVGLIENSAKNGAEDDYLAYIKKNRAEVDRTEAEVMFIMRIVQAIHNL